jgi:hypothetical protein
MSTADWGLLIALIDTSCWIICFVWMYRLSAKQNRMLDEIHDQGQRIERLSREEHDLIREVHPQVGQIKGQVDSVAAAVDKLS